jgi:hypothetical protein
MTLASMRVETLSVGGSSTRSSSAYKRYMVGSSSTTETSSRSSARPTKVAAHVARVAGAPVVGGSPSRPAHYFKKCRGTVVLAPLEPAARTQGGALQTRDGAA